MDTGEHHGARNSPSTPPTVETIALILNPKAGTLDRAGLSPDDVMAIFAQNGLSPRLHLLGHDSDDIGAFVAKSVGDGIGTIVAGGGDGTISAVAGHLIGTDVVLGVLPLGTLNHFAKDLGIPLDLEGAVQVIADGATREVDAAQVNDAYFINNSSLGLYPLTVGMREKEQESGSAKWPAMARSVLRVFGRYPLLRLRMKVEGRDIVRRTPLVFIGNNEYVLRGFELSDRKRLDAGILSVCITHDVGRLGLIGLALRALFGRVRDSDKLDVLQEKELLIESHHHTVRVAVDGEVTTQRPPLRYRSLPRALRVLAPPPAATEAEPAPLA